VTHGNPIAQFQEWLDAAQRHPVDQPDAMTLATVSAEGRPSARVVLLRGVDQLGFRFYSNRSSRKGTELRANPQAALLFHWQAMGRQVRVEGTVSLLDDAASDSYFASRPYESRLAAWASEQSQVIESREALVARFEEMAVRFAGREVPRPEDWGGFLLSPSAIEFWEHGDHRLHDRRLYTRASDSSWSSHVLAP
jgi:pyridoxamine 5'-phosphate oxidase